MKKNLAFHFFIGIFAILAFAPAHLDAQPVALAELFSNTHCPNCPAQDDPYYVYLSTHPGMILINYHNATPYAQDPFYLASYPFVQTRDLFYGAPNLQSDPSASFNGDPAPPTESIWETFSNHALQQSLVPIRSSVANGPNGIDTISFSFTGTTQTEVRYYVALKESKLVYANSGSDGNPTGGYWNDIFRCMLPNGNGSQPFIFSGNHQFDTVFDPNNPNYNFSGNEQNMVAVIFVQDVNESSSGGNYYPIEALDTIPLAASAGVTQTAPSSNRLIVPANPMTPEGEFQFELAAPGEVHIGIYDLLGRQIRTLVDGMMPSGQTTVDMNGTALPAGCYLARLIVDGRVSDQAKFIVAP